MSPAVNSNVNGLWLRLTLSTVGILAASILVAAGIACLGVIGYLALSEVTPPLFAASMAFLSAVSVTALASVATHALLTRARLAPPAAQSLAQSPSSPSDNQLLTAISGVIGAELSSTIRAHPYEAALASLVAGFAIGAVPGLRDGLLQLFVKRQGL
jgi:hypothetical protein